MAAVGHAPLQSGLVQGPISEVEVVSYISLNQLGHLLLDGHPLEEVRYSVIQSGVGVLIQRRGGVGGLGQPGQDGRAQGEKGFHCNDWKST